MTILPHQPAEVRDTSARSAGQAPAVDLPRLENWLARAGLGPGPMRDVVPLAGGTQNVMVRFRLGDEHLVLRHPPTHKRPESDEVIRREIRVLRLLSGTGVPTPRLRAACEDLAVLGSVFHVSDFVRGFAPAHGLPVAFRERLDWQTEMGLSMVDVLARLGTVPIEPAIAAGFRPPDRWLERQPGRWLRQLEGYPDSELLDAGRVLAGWLRDTMPTSWQPGLIHGDFHLGNVLISHDAPRVAAVVDWELVTIGDPLLDIAHLIVGWPVGNAEPAHTGLSAPGLPDPASMIERYAASGPDVHDLEWYAVLACFRLGVLLEGTWARARTGAAPEQTGRRLHRLAASHFDRAISLIDGSPAV